MNPWIALAAVAIGGAIGSVARFLVGNWFVQRFGPAFPWGTLTINLTGAFLIGVVLQLAQTRAGLPPYARVFLATGLLGGYTTFSTYAYETYFLGREGFATQSAFYGFGSIIAGVAAVFLGIALARVIVP